MTRAQRGTLVATGLGLFMIFLDALIVNVALPDIQQAFGVGESGLQWTVTAYSMGMAIFMMTSATLADRLGRRRVYVTGLVVFTVASATCGLAPAIWVLNGSRAVQGLAAAVVNVTSLALLSAAFTDPKAKARAIGYWTAIASVGTALGPSLGGFLTEWLDWRSVFFVNVPVGIVALVLTARYVAESRDPTERSFDVVGQVLFVLAIGSFAYAIIEGPQVGWLAPGILVAYGVFVVSGVAFARWELDRPEPMMDLRLFTNRAYTLAIAALFAALFAAYGMLLVITQFYQNVRDFSPVVTGLLIFPFSLALLFFTPLVGRLVGEVGARRLILFGLVLLVAGFAVEIVGITVTRGVVVVGLAVVGVGAAFTAPPTTAVAMSSVPEDRSGMASGILSAQRAIGSTAGYAILGSILVAWLGATLNTDLETAIPDASQREAVTDQIIDNADPRAYAAEIGPGRPIESTSDATRDEIADAADNDFEQGIQLALGVGALVVAVVFVVGWFGFPDDDPRRAASESRAPPAGKQEGLRTR